MPTYSSQCLNCKDSGDVRLSFVDYDLIQKGENTLVCNTCQGQCQILFDPSSVQLVFKDGESGGWQSKALKENKYRANRRLALERKERDHVFKPQLQPNFRGVETGTWKEAQEYARTEVAKDHGQKAGNASASTFIPLVEKASS